MVCLCIRSITRQHCGTPIHASAGHGGAARQLCEAATRRRRCGAAPQQLGRCAGLPVGERRHVGQTGMCSCLHWWRRSAAALRVAAQRRAWEGTRRQLAGCSAAGRCWCCWCECHAPRPCGAALRAAAATCAAVMSLPSLHRSLTPSMLATSLCLQACLWGSKLCGTCGLSLCRPLCGGWQARRRRTAAPSAAGRQRRSSGAARWARRWASGGARCCWQREWWWWQQACWRTAAPLPAQPPESCAPSLDHPDDLYISYCCDRPMLPYRGGLPLPPHTSASPTHHHMQTCCNAAGTVWRQNGTLWLHCKLDGRCTGLGKTLELPGAVRRHKREVSCTPIH